MKVNFAATITGLNNEPIRDQAGNDFTLSSVASQALLAPYEDEKNLSGDEKVRRFKLAERAYESGEQEISVEDAALLKKLIAKAFAALVVGRAYELIG